MSESYPDNAEQEKLFETSEDVAPFEYELLKGHYRTDGTFKSDEELKTEYVRLTDDLIHRMANGIEVTDPVSGEKTTKPVDFVVWLDKSARPLSWLTRDLWPLMARDQDGNIPPQPQHKFVNIDRNQWTSTIDPDGIGSTDVSRLDDTIIRSLRSIFLEKNADRSEGLTDRIDSAPSLFDGKTVLIVDEVRSSGRTLQYAHSLFRRAFPDATVGTTYWMGGVTVKNGAVGNADLPVWYSDKTDYGRGIGNRHVDRSRLSASTAQRLGAWFLSTPLPEADPKSQQLRVELRQLSEDAREGRMLVEPSRERDDYEMRALSLNKDIETFDEFLAERKGQIDK